MSKYRKVLDESVNVTSLNKGFRTVQHNVAIYNKPRKDFHPTRFVEIGIPTKPLKLVIVTLIFCSRFISSY